MEKITPEMFAAFAKERYGLNVTFRKSEDPDTFEKLFGVKLDDAYHDVSEYVEFDSLYLSDEIAWQDDSSCARSAFFMPGDVAICSRKLAGNFLSNAVFASKSDMYGISYVSTSQQNNVMYKSVNKGAA